MFGYLDLALKAIMQNWSPLGEVSFLVVEDLVQFPPVNQKGMFMKRMNHNDSYRLFNECLWKKCQLYELVETVNSNLI